MLLTVLGQEGLDAVDASVDGLQGRVELPHLDERRGNGPGVHHGDVGAILVEHHFVARVARVVAHELKQPQVAASVAGAEFVLLEMPEAEVAVVILHPLAHQFEAVTRFEKIGLGRVIGGVLALAALEVFEPRVARFGSLAVGSAVALHLEQP